MACVDAGYGDVPEVDGTSLIDPSREDSESPKVGKKTEPGMAEIKQQYVLIDYKPKLAAKILPQSFLKELSEETSDNSGVPLSKKQKLKGRNKSRPIEKKPEAGDKLCPSVVAEVNCEFGEKCKFIHDVEKYMAAKPKDIADRCHVFETFGKCRCGLTCRFGSQHISAELKNVVRDELYEKKKEELDTKNSLAKTTQRLLWKRRYDFTPAFESVKRIKGKVSVEDGNVSGGGSKSDVDIQEKSAVVSEISHTDTNATAAKVDSNEPDSTCQDAINQRPDQSKDLPFEEKVCSIPVEEVEKTAMRDLDKVSVSQADVNASSQAHLGPVTDEDAIALNPREIKKIDFSNKLYLAPLTTVGNLPFRRICKRLGADITCSEMALDSSLLQGNRSEWALVKRHASEDLFGVQLCGGHPENLTKCAQLLTETIDLDFIDLNCGCPIDLIFKKRQGSAMMSRAGKFCQIVASMTNVMNVPLTVKLRTGIYEDKNIAHNLIPKLRESGVSMVTVHGRSREQRYTRLADWDYISQCAKIASPMPLYGNGDILSYEDANLHRENTEVAGLMIARGALIKPWLFTEIKEQRHWDISSSERLDILKEFTNNGLEHWGSDQQGVGTTRRFLLEWLSFLHRYIPVGLLETVPQKINLKPPPYCGRDDLETLMASPNCGDWVKISEMLLGPVPSGFTFLPKHKANAYK